MHRQSEPTDRAEVTKLATAVEAALAEVMQTSYSNPGLPSHKDGPSIGTTPAVAQPGRPPMSPGATDASVMMLSAGVASLPIGGMTALVLHALGTVDPAQLAIGGTVPVALVLAVARLLGRARDVLPDEHHHHYNGEVHQQHVHNHTTNRWWGKSTTNQ